MPGSTPIRSTGSRAVPIYQTTSYVFDDTDHAAALFNLERAGHIYTRISNPTTAVLEERLAALEHGVGAVARRAAWRRCTSPSPRSLARAITSSPRPRSMAARSISWPIRCRASASPPHSSSRAIWTASAPPSSPNTRLLIAETIGNPGLEVLDIPRAAEIAHDAGLPLLIDNTFATPYLCRPHRAWCRYRHEFADQMDRRPRHRHWRRAHRRRPFRLGGVRQVPDADRAICRLSWPHLCRSSSAQPPSSCARAPKACAISAPASRRTNAFHLLQGIETLALRMERHIENTAAVLDFLTKHEAVSWVLHPSLESHPDYELAQRLLPKGAGSIVSFGIKGGRAAGRKFIEALKLASHLANVGDAKTLVIHPASTTHQQMDARAARRRGHRRGYGAPFRWPRSGGRYRRRFRAGVARLAEGLSRCGSSQARKFCRDWRPRFRSGLPAIVFLHGAGFDHSAWALLAARSRITA